MIEMEAPTEQLQEEIQHHAQESWHLRVALSSALLAVLAALAALLGGHYANEAMIEQIRSSDAWSHYQAKSIKAAVTKSKLEMLEALGKPAPAETREQLKKYEEDQAEISGEAKEMAEKSEKFLTKHSQFAYSLTFFQVAIGIGAISVLTRKPAFWKLSLGVGIFGLFFLIRGIFLL